MQLFGSRLYHDTISAQGVYHSSQWHIAHEKLQGVVLGHLSKDNNIPELAYETVRVELAMGSEIYKEYQFPITVAKRDEVSPVIRIA